MFRRTRTTYLETKEDREAIRLADEEEYGPRFIKGKPGQEIDIDLPKLEEPEFESVEAFVEFLLDEERESFSFEELEKLQNTVGRFGLLKQVVAYGFRYEGRPKERNIRGFTSNSHNLYQGNPMSGGSGMTPNGVGSRF